MKNDNRIPVVPGTIFIGLFFGVLIEVAFALIVFAIARSLS